MSAVRRRRNLNKDARVDSFVSTCSPAQERVVCTYSSVVSTDVPGFISRPTIQSIPVVYVNPNICVGGDTQAHTITTHYDVTTTLFVCLRVNIYAHDYRLAARYVHTLSRQSSGCQKKSPTATTYNNRRRSVRASEHYPNCYRKANS